MEFLKSTNTNAQAIGDFEAVAFQAFSVARTPTLKPKTHEWNPSEDIRAAEAEIRSGQHLVIQDASRPWLWLFRAATADQAGQKPPELPTIEGYRFHREQYGVMKASELARPPMRPANSNPSASSSTSSPLTPGAPKGLQSGGGRQSQGSAQFGGADQQQQYDSFAIYELFTSSVVALISYYLVRDHKAVALNYRTFVSRPTDQKDSETPTFPSSPVPHWLTNINVLWSSSGTLVVSTFSLTKSSVYCLDEVDAEDEQKLVGKCVRVSPNGVLAMLVGFDDPVDAAAEEVGHRLQRKRAKINPFEQSIERWKSAVNRWLSWKGYFINGLEKKSSWVRIRIGHLNQTTVPSPAPLSGYRDLLWPRALCFLFCSSTIKNPPRLGQQSTTRQGDEALEWFEMPGSQGFKDPVDAAQKWFVGKPERDKIVEARRRAKKIEEDAARAKEEHHGLFPSSPLNARTGPYGDLQAVSGVYPTPPDGIPPGTAVSSGDTPSVSGIASSMILAPGGTNPAINISAPQETPNTDGPQHPLTSPVFPAPFDQYNGDGGNDDLFEDIDEDNFDGNGVTDADFNFFDEPDGEDADMLDAPSVEDVKPILPKKLEKEKASPAIPDPEIKEEPTDPMAALESALASASTDTQECVQDAEPQQHASRANAFDRGPVASMPSQPLSSRGQVTVSFSKEPTPPLSPRFIENALLPSPKDKHPPQTPQKQMQTRHRDSVFDPLSFSRKMSLSDAKYRDGRFGFPSEKSEKGKKEPKDPSRRPKSLRDLPLLTKLRYAIGVASASNIPEVASSADADSDLSDTSSETSSVVEDDVDETVSVARVPLPSGVIIPVKRKLPTEGNATPMSATSFADSFGGEFFDTIGLQTDEMVLTSLEPSIWDWSLVNFPPPAERSSTGSRFSMPTFSSLPSSIPNTPTSQPDLSMDFLDEKPLGGKDSIAVAQMVTDQIISATLDLLQESQSSGTEIITNRLPSETKWQQAIKSIFPKATDCNVVALASVSDVYPDVPVQAKGQQRPPPRKPNEGPATLSHHMHQISAPYLRVRRADSQWDLLPPALAFWEPLGLSPCSPPKNVVAFGIYPHSGSLRPCVENFLVNVQLAYDNCRLGNHTRVETVPEYEGGLVPCKMNSQATSTRTAFKALRDTCIQLGKLLAVKHSQMRGKEDTKIDAFVIYMIDPFEKPAAIWELCSAFWTLFQAYGQGPPGRLDQPQKPDLVLQIVPIKYVASSEAPIILDSSTYASLAREVYDRCPPSAPSEDKTPLNIYTAPSFQLEEPVPRSIPFKLNAEPPQDLLHENSYIHLSYAVSLDGAWVTAAWTDICGKSQAVVSYNLGTRMFGEIAKEIWQTTIEILQARRVTWRVCIAKAGVMDREEVEAWVFLVSCPTQLNLFITLLTVDTDPHLKFTPTIPPTGSSTNPSATGGPSANTPGSTPQAGVSPEHGLTPAATPSAENAADPTADPEARLVDATDETWGIILAHRLHNSNSISEWRPALISGLLVKRGLSSTPSQSVPNTPDPECGPIILAVNILWMGAVNPTRAATSPFPSGDGISPGGGAQGPSPLPMPQERSYSSLTWTPTVQTRAAAENLLKEVLGQFRGLGLLARLKGMRGTRHGTVPWHVAAAIRGVKGLGTCLPQ